MTPLLGASSRELLDEPIWQQLQGQQPDLVRARIEARGPGGAHATLTPERRFYPERQSETTEATDCSSTWA